MSPESPFFHDDFADLAHGAEQADATPEQDLWFLPGPIEEDPDYLPPGPRAELPETAILADWTQAELDWPHVWRVSLDGSEHWTGGCAAGPRAGGIGLR